LAELLIASNDRTDSEVHTVFVVEDETLIRMMIVDMIEELGHRTVAEAGTIKDAQSFAQNGLFDFAILDINVGGEDVFPIASILQARGLPFLFSSGYGTTGLSAPFHNMPVLPKPFLVNQLKAAIDTMFASGRAC
jgi:DNA-binding response OmpR family regulator